MGGRALVEIEQFVGLGATELAPTTEERFQARPLVGVRGHIGVQVHAATVCRVSEPMIATIGVTEDDLVTGEAVALDLPPASIGLRILSGLLDLVIIETLLYVVLVAGALLVTSLDEALGSAIMLLLTVAGLVGFPTAMLTLTRGKTVGKLAAGLRVVRDDAGPITFRHALTRSLIAVVEVFFLLGIPAVITSLINPRGKRLGDIAAGTYVVRERTRANLPPPVPMPPHLAAWAASADIAALPDRLAAEIRTFLPAAFSMDPGARDELGRSLLDEVMGFVSPLPPPGNHPEYVLAAVVADRRRRDLDRLMRDAALRDRVIPPDPLVPRH